ncbi:hypothetical protein DFJ74DRAFT_774810 [Hyaloraphidium curvatum]|nr:hypothetical protein DFJ74DRAFT_774810 [Hyaloraphidium curvatum]
MQPRTVGSLRAGLLATLVLLAAALRRVPPWRDGEPGGEGRPLVVVHVGPHKTGSTTLQDTLCAWRDGLAADGVGVFAPAAGEECGKSVAPAAFALRGHANGDGGVLAGLLAEVSGVRGNASLVVSSEEFDACAAIHLKPLAASAEHAEIAVVAVHRRFAARVPSLYAQLSFHRTDFGGPAFLPFVASGRAVPYAAILQNWLAAFPDARFVVASLEGCAALHEDPVPAALAAALGSRAPAWMANATAAPARANRSNVSVLGSNATYASFLEWAMLGNLTGSAGPGGPAARLWTARPARHCAAAMAPALLRGRLPVACRSFASEADAADAEDLDALRWLRSEIGDRLELVCFGKQGGEIRLPEPEDGAGAVYCEVDREAVGREPGRFAGVLAEASAQVAAACLA